MSNLNSSQFGGEEQYTRQYMAEQGNDSPVRKARGYQPMTSNIYKPTFSFDENAPTTPNPSTSQNLTPGRNLSPDEF